MYRADPAYIYIYISYIYIYIVFVGFGTFPGMLRALTESEIPVVGDLSEGSTNNTLTQSRLLVSMIRKVSFVGYAY